MFAGERPSRGDGGVLDPERTDGFRDGGRVGVQDDAVAAVGEGFVAERAACAGGMRELGRGADHGAVRAEMVEARVVERQHGRRQRGDLRVGVGRVAAERGAEAVVEVVGRDRAAGERARSGVPAAFAEQDADGALREEPHAAVEREREIRGEFADAVGGRLLKEELDRTGFADGAEKDAVAAGLLGRGRNADDQHVRLRERGHRAVVADERVAAGDGDAVGRRRVAQQVRERGLLERQERLAGGLAAGAVERRDGQARLAQGRVGGQAAALAAGVDDQLARRGEPVARRAVRREGAPRLEEQMGRSSAGAELAAGRVAAGERGARRGGRAEPEAGGRKGYEVFDVRHGGASCCGRSRPRRGRCRRPSARRR